MDIPRYGHDYYGELIATANGYLVYHEDHAAEVARLNEQVRALVAEVKSVREQSEDVYAGGYNQGHLNTVDGIAYAPGTKDDFYHNALQVMAEIATPATDAILNEIGANAFEGFSVWVEKNGHAAATETDLPVKKISDACVKLASIYAEIIRKGESQ